MPTDIVEANELILTYKETGDIALRNQIVLQYGSMVKYIAVSMRNLYSKYADVEDVINECIITLISAIDGFDVNKNVKFETYASIRIKGAIIDFIRKQDFIPRSVRVFSKEFEKTYTILYAELFREPTSDEIAERMNLTGEKFRKLMGESASAATLSFEELLYENNFEISEVSDPNAWEAEKGLVHNELASNLAQAIDTLKEKEKNVISLYYYEKLKFSDIAKVLQVTESRVCQIHAKAIVKLRIALKEYLSQ